MPWNYRIRQRIIEESDGEVHPWFDVVECFYNTDEQAEEYRNHYGYTVESMEPVAESLEDLKSILESMLKALDKPIIKEN